jgi:hypothetical protein
VKARKKIVNRKKTVKNRMRILPPPGAPAAPPAALSALLPSTKVGAEIHSLGLLTCEVCGARKICTYLFLYFSFSR